MATDSVFPVRPRRRRKTPLKAGAVVAGLSTTVMVVAAVVLLVSGR